MSASPIPGHHAPSWLRRYGLIFALLMSYVAMTLLVVEQGRVIDSQRRLIRQLFSDSQELTALKIRNNQDKHQH